MSQIISSKQTLQSTSAISIGPSGKRHNNEHYIPSDEATDNESENENNLELVKPHFWDFKYVTGQGAGYTACDISKIADNFFRLGEKYLLRFSLLKKLNISGLSVNNNLTDGSIAKLCKNLTNLEVLTAENCEITSIVGVEFPKGIRTLSFANNNLVTLPELTNVDFLEKLDLSSNKFDYFTSESLKAAYSLNTLDLSNNELSSIDLRHFDQCLALKNIDLSNNHLKIESTSIVWPEKELVQVRELNLSANLLTSIPSKQITKFLPGIFKLDLSENCIDVTPDLDFEELAKLQYFCDFLICGSNKNLENGNPNGQTQNCSSIVKNLILFKLRKLQRFNGEIIDPEEKVNADNLFQPSLDQIARNDRLRQDLFDVQEHKEEIPEITLPNMEPYPIFVLTGPNSLMKGVKEIATSACGYLELMERCRVTIQLDDMTKHPDLKSIYNHPDYNPISKSDFNMLDQHAFFACTSSTHEKVFAQTNEPLITNIKYGLSKLDLENNAKDGVATIVELPIEAALSLNHSEKYRPILILILPSKDDFEKAWQTTLQNIEKKIASMSDQNSENIDENLKMFLEKANDIYDAAIDEFKKLQELAINDLGTFSVILDPVDLDVLVEFLSSSLEYSYIQRDQVDQLTEETSMNTERTNTENSSEWGDIRSDVVSSSARSGGKNNRNNTNSAVFSTNILPKDMIARRQSLAQQARRKTMIYEYQALNKKIGSNSHSANSESNSSSNNIKRHSTVGSNVIFEITDSSLARRTEKALAAISQQENLLFCGQDLYDSIDDIDLQKELRESINPDNNNNNFNLNIDSPRSVRTLKSGRITGNSTKSPDWEAEGIIVLADDAQTLSHCPSEPGNRRSVTSAMSSVSKKSVLPPIGQVGEK